MVPTFIQVLKDIHPELDPLTTDHRSQALNSLVICALAMKKTSFFSMFIFMVSFAMPQRERFRFPYQLLHVLDKLHTA